MSRESPDFFHYYSVLRSRQRKYSGFDPGRVAKALGLTPAESRVAVALAEGKTIDGIATGTGRSRTTVKWHIRHIYAELGVSRPIELAQLVASLADIPGARG